MDTISKTRLALSTLTVFRGILADKAMQKYTALLEAVHGVDIRRFVDAYCEFYNVLLSENTISASNFLSEKIKSDDNIFSQQAKTGGRQSVSGPVYSAALHDIGVLKAAALGASIIKETADKNFGCGEYGPLIGALPEWEVSDAAIQDADTLCAFYQKNGTGNYSVSNKDV